MSVSLREVIGLRSNPILPRRRARSQPSTYRDEHNEIDQEQDFVPPKAKQTINYRPTPEAKQEVEWFKWLASDCKKLMPAGDMPDWVEKHLQPASQDGEMTGSKRKSEDSEYADTEDEKKQLMVKLKVPTYVLEKFGVFRKIFGSKEATPENQVEEGVLELPVDESKSETGSGTKSTTQERADDTGVSVTNGVEDLDERETRLEKVRSEIAAKQIKLNEIRAMKAAKKAARKAKRKAKKLATEKAAAAV